MGWFGPKTEVSSHSWDSPPSPKGENTSNIFDSKADPPIATAAAPKAVSRQDIAEQELQAFIQELNADAQPKTTKYTRLSRQQQQQQQFSNPSSPTTGTDTEDSLPISEQLLPKTMSCRQAFDEAFYCNSLGGKFNDIYRYGGLQPCSENWSAFWFCMRTKGYGDEQKAEAIRDHYRHRLRLKYPRDTKGKSSEDIWKSRDKKMEPGEAFNVPVPEFDGDDDEWNRRERGRRRGRVDGSMS